MTQDFTTLNNPKFLYQAELHHPFPSWIANVPMPEAPDFEKNASTAFADPVRRLLPIATKEAAFHSAINVFADLESYSVDAFDRVKDACDHFDIAGEVAPYALLFADNIEKSASDAVRPDGHFAIDTEILGKRFQLLPLNDKSDVLTSAYDLTKMAADHRIHILQLVPAARRVIKAASEKGVSNLPLLISRLGYDRFADLDKAARLVKGRASLVKDESVQGMQKHYDAAVKEASDGDITAEECFEKIAAIDDSIGLSPNFHKSAAVPISFEIVFGGPLLAEAEKQAKSHVLCRDVLIPLAEVQRINPLDVEFRMSKEASAHLKGIDQVGDARDLSLAIETWPEVDQRAFLRLAAAV